MSLASLSPLSATPADRAAISFTSTSSPRSRSSDTNKHLSAFGVPNEIAELKRRTNALQAECDHYLQLSQRAADAFEEHRRDLTQLAQKERAIRARREDALRTQLQETLKENQTLMTRVVEQRRQQDEAWRAKLQSHREDNAQRQAELEALLTQLHSERAELQRSVARTEQKQDLYRRDIESCLADQGNLRDKIRLLQDGLSEVEELEGESGGRHQVHHGATYNFATHSSPASWPSRRGGGGRQLCCECCDVPCDVWTGLSPRRRVPRRRFVPAGPWDLSSPSRAASPTTHHVDALVSSIERENYMRPRLYYQRAGLESEPLVEPRAAAAHEHARGDEASEEASPPRSHAAVPHHFFSSSSPSSHTQRHSGSQQRHSSYFQSRSPGLSSTTPSRGTAANTSASSTSTPSSALSSTDMSAPLSKHDERDEQPRQLPSSRAHHNHGVPSPYRRRTINNDDDNSIHSHYHNRSPQQRHPQELLPSAHTTTFSSLPTHAAVETSGEDRYYGAATNAACHALVADLASMRAAYLRFQAQLRDPRGDSVEASQEMRRLMRRMDEKAHQLRTLRKEQSKRQDSLRVHDVLRQVMAENQYCEAVYTDLIELIRS